IEVQHRLDRRGAARRDVARHHPQLRRHPRLDHAVGIGRVSGQPRAGAVDDVAVLVEAELAVARVGDHAAVGQAEEARAVDREIERIRGGREIALRELLGDPVDLHAEPAELGPGSVDRVRDHVAELGPRRLGADRVGIGHVVADDVEIARRRAESGKSMLETHCLLLVNYSFRRRRLAPDPYLTPRTESRPTIAPEASSRSKPLPLRVTPTTVDGASVTAVTCAPSFIAETWK